MRGRICALPAGKNFGFLIGDGEEFRRFFPASAVAHKPCPFDDLEMDDLVEFEPETEAGQPRARAVVLMMKMGDYLAAYSYDHELEDARRRRADARRRDEAWENRGNTEEEDLI